MKNHELQALRRLLFYTPQEAAALIAASTARPEGVDVRAWQYWEDGRRAVPDDVKTQMHALCVWRRDAIETARAVIKKNRGGHPARIVFYGHMIDWVGEPILWRPHQSVCAELASRGCELVPFDSSNYAAWLGDRTDSEQMRGAWAASL